MNQTLLFVLIAIPATLFLFFIFRTNQRRMQRLVNPQDIEDAVMRMQNVIPADAVVQSKKETINPDAKGYAKVDLELKIQPASGETLLAKTCWLVKVESLPELEAGCSVKVKYNPKKVKIIYPDVPWAQAWVFGD
jgi:hypothetical protein